MAGCETPDLLRFEPTLVTRTIIALGVHHSSLIAFRVKRSRGNWEDLVREQLTLACEAATRASHRRLPSSLIRPLLDRPNAERVRDPFERAVADITARVFPLEDTEQDQVTPAQQQLLSELTQESSEQLYPKFELQFVHDPGYRVTDLVPSGNSLMDVFPERRVAKGEYGNHAVVPEEFRQDAANRKALLTLFSDDFTYVPGYGRKRLHKLAADSFVKMRANASQDGVDLRLADDRDGGDTGDTGNRIVKAALELQKAGIKDEEGNYLPLYSDDPVNNPIETDNRGPAIHRLLEVLAEHGIRTDLLKLYDEKNRGFSWCGVAAAVAALQGGVTDKTFLSVLPLAPKADDYGMSVESYAPNQRDRYLDWRSERQGELDQSLLEDAARRERLLRDFIRPGDIIVFKSWNAKKGVMNSKHVGIVLSYDPHAGLLKTIEGNTRNVPNAPDNQMLIREYQLKKQAEKYFDLQAKRLLCFLHPPESRKPASGTEEPRDSERTLPKDLGLSIALDLPSVLPEKSPAAKWMFLRAHLYDWYPNYDEPLGRVWEFNPLGLKQVFEKYFQK